MGEINIKIPKGADDYECLHVLIPDKYEETGVSLSRWEASGSDDIWLNKKEIEGILKALQKAGRLETFALKWASRAVAKPPIKATEQVEILKCPDCGSECHSDEDKDVTRVLCTNCDYKYFKNK